MGFRGVVDTQGELPTNANPGDAWLVLTPSPPYTWVWSGTAWRDAGEMGQGPTGATGASGAQGPQGPVGATGGTGGTGGVGASGLQGPVGASGASGQAGASGEPGATGPAGATGATGLAGEGVTTGAAPPSTPSAGDIWISPQGEIFVWQVGPGWVQAVGVIGATGPAGATGATGPAGEGVTVGSTTPPATPEPGEIWTTIDGALFVYHSVAGWIQIA